MISNIQDKNIPNFHLNYNVVPYYEDNYTWQELHCLYRPLALSYNCINDNYFDLFLLILSFYHTYMINDTFRNEIFNRNDPVFEFANNTLASGFGVKIECIEYNDITNMKELVAGSLYNGDIVIFPEDIYNIYYSPTYMESHDAHYVILKGYDMKKEVVYVLDSLQIDEGRSIKFLDFTMRFNDLYNACETYRDTYDVQSENMYFWTIKKGQGSIKKIFDLFKMAIIDRINERVKYSFIEKNFLEEIQKGIGSIEYNEYLRTINFRKVFFQSLINVVGKYFENKDELIDRIVDTRNKWETAKIRIMSVNQNNKDKISRIKNTLDKAISADNALLEIIVNNMDKIKFVEFDNQKNNIINKKQIDYWFDDGIIKVKHTSDKICDTWLLHDNAWQLYINDITKESGKLEMKVLCDGNEASSFQAGIIINAGNKRYMFGNARNSEIAVFCPEEHGNTTIMEVPIKDKNNCYICTEYQDTYIKFYIKSNENEKYKCVKSICVGECIKSIGIFSKTWEAVDNIVLFDEILYNDKSLSII